MSKVKYTCKMKKEDILATIVEEFKRALDDSRKTNTPRNEGRYIAMADLLRKIEIFENEEEGDSK